MDGYKYVTNGCIENVEVVTTPACPSIVLACAHVRHSQRITATPLKPWVAVEQSGAVVCAHCDCMAGLGEACSHIAAVLFALEANTQVKKAHPCLVPGFHLLFKVSPMQQLQKLTSSSRES